MFNVTNTAGAWRKRAATGNGGVGPPQVKHQRPDATFDAIQDIFGANEEF